MHEYKRMEFDEEFMPMLRKHRRKAVQELERLMEMEPSAGVEQAMMPVLLMLMGAEFVEEHCGKHHEKREHDDEEHHTKSYPMNR